MSSKTTKTQTQTQTTIKVTDKEREMLERMRAIVIGTKTAQATDWVGMGQSINLVAGAAKLIDKLEDLGLVSFRNAKGVKQFALTEDAYAVLGIKLPADPPALPGPKTATRKTQRGERLEIEHEDGTKTTKHAKRGKGGKFEELQSCDVCERKFPQDELFYNDDLDLVNCESCQKAHDAQKNTKALAAKIAAKSSAKTATTKTAPKVPELPKCVSCGTPTESTRLRYSAAMEGNICPVCAKGTVVKTSAKTAKIDPAYAKAAKNADADETPKTSAKKSAPTKTAPAPKTTPKTQTTERETKHDDAQKQAWRDETWRKKVHAESMGMTMPEYMAWRKAENQSGRKAPSFYAAPGKVWVPDASVAHLFPEDAKNAPAQTAKTTPKQIKVGKTEKPEAPKTAKKAADKKSTKPEAILARKEQLVREMKQKSIAQAREITRLSAEHDAFKLELTEAIKDLNSFKAGLKQ